MSDNITVIISDIATSGTMGVQNASAVAITGGTMDAVAITNGTIIGAAISAGTIDISAGTIDMPTLAKATSTTRGASTAFVHAVVADYAPLASPTLTGVPVAPTASAATNTTQLATTAFVQLNVAGSAGTVSPTFTGTPLSTTPTGGDNTTWIATSAFVQGELTGYAPIASPALTGSPTAPTQSASDNSTKLATTAYADAAATGHTHPQSEVTDLVTDLTALQDADSNYEIVVKQASDLSGTLLSTKVYVIDGVIDMGTQTITVPIGGLEIKGHGVNTSKLLSTENSYTMFVDASNDAGNIFISEVTIEVSGTSSLVFDLDNSGAGGAAEINSTNFEDCTSLGTLDAYRQFLLMNSFWLGCNDGLTFAGAWAGGAFIDTLLIRDFDPLGGGNTVFTGSTSPALTFASRFYCNANINVPTGATVFDFAASMFTNDGDFELITGEYTGAGTVVAVKSPVIDNTSTKSRFRDNNGLDNTYIGGRWYIDTGNAVVTTISIVDTFVKAAGTTTEEDLQWTSSAGDNDLTFDSTQDVKVQIIGSINVTAASGGSDKNITLTIRHWDNSAGGYVDLPNKARGVSTSAATYHNVAVIGYATVSENDRIELWIENNTDTVNLTVEEGSLFSVSERAN